MFAPEMRLAKDEAEIFLHLQIFRGRQLVLQSPELLVIVMMQRGIFSAPFSSIKFFSAVKSIFPLKGAGMAECFPSSHNKSIPSAPLNSMLALVVSNNVLLIINFLLPPKILNKIFSAGHPWCVGITMGIPVIKRTVSSK